MNPRCSALTASLPISSLLFVVLEQHSIEKSVGIFSEASHKLMLGRLKLELEGTLVHEVPDQGDWQSKRIRNAKNNPFNGISTVYNVFT